MPGASPPLQKTPIRIVWVRVTFWISPNYNAQPILAIDLRTQGRYTLTSFFAASLGLEGACAVSYNLRFNRIPDNQTAENR